MKYNDRGTKLLTYKHKNKQETTTDFYEVYRNKIVKKFSREVLISGVDPEWWSLVSKEKRYSLCQNYEFAKTFTSGEKVNLKDYVEKNKKDLVDISKLRELKLRKLLK
jgi:hypothetical protein